MARGRDSGVTAQRTWLAVFLTGGALLRIHGLTDHGLWIDEYGTAWTVAGSAAECFWRAVAIQGQSPLYYWIAQASTRLVGPGLLGLRLPSLVFGVGLLAFSFPLALRFYGNHRVALLVVAAFAVNERLIYYSQEARPYALALLCAAGSFYFFASLLSGGGRRARIGYWLTTALTWYAHYLFGVVVLAQGLTVLLQRPRRLARLRPWLLTFGALVPLLAPGLLQLLPLFGRRETLDWINTPSGLVAGLTAGMDLLDPWLLAALAAALAAAWWRERRFEPLAAGARPGLAFLWLAVPVLVFVVLAPLLGVRLLHARYLAIAIPAVPLLQGALMSLPRGGRWLRALPVALFLCVSLGLRVLPLVERDGGRFWWFVHQDWGAAVAQLVRAHREGDLVLYRTGFVELDQLVRGRASARTTEFVGWPILAHLPTGGSFRLQPLPYRDSAELGGIVASVIEHEAPRRVWIVGLDPEDPTSETFAGLVAMAQHGPRLRAVGHRNYGVVHLVLLRPQDPAAPGRGAGS